MNVFVSEVNNNALGVTDRVMELANKIGVETTSFFDWINQQYKAVKEGVEDSIKEID